MITGVALFEQTAHYRGAWICVEHDDAGHRDVVVDAGVQVDEQSMPARLLVERLAEATAALDGAGYVQLTPWLLEDGHVHARVLAVAGA